MELFKDVDLYALVTPAIMFLSGCLLGRLTKRTKRALGFNHTLVNLNHQILVLNEQKSFYAFLHSRLKLISLFLLLLFLMLSYYLHYFNSLNLPINSKDSLITGGFFTVTIYGFAYLCLLISEDYDKKYILYKQRVNLNKDEIIKEIGPEVVDLIRSTECSKKCEEKTQALEKNLKRHKDLIEKFKIFQWCDGCSQGKKCSQDCGPRFFIYVKESMKDFKSA